MNNKTSKRRAELFRLAFYAFVYLVTLALIKLMRFLIHA